MRLLTAILVVGLGVLAFTPKAASSPGKADWIVVLGAAQYNGEPSVIFRNRLEAALQLYRQGYAPRIAVTGGRRPGDRYSEGEVGCRYLEARGVPRRALFCEQKSRRTWENLSNIAPVLGGSRAIIVTDEPHLPRALILADQLGLRATGYAVRGNFRESYRQREAWLALLARLGIR
ncbi:MAG: YdcF family protein [Meiothermus sp.]|uniref:YdcF family protein n=1 Tax=Meiothermus sp. TaxID=1955249 RepID=UPI0025E3A1A8|nr:YdcF family protein [Meiothermus sp.]MCS7059350.1 YdcF family protein [Meiothermus sp.]MCS7194284.1 YdcF family protein [Meiothermus sp.]MCX7741264.1 YdcF family protein [Meiothermus sp.]MDW8090700.1 YdcF family protein [Meiothermus sp.]MDW8482546.1 YdcF family protein [Meiothermus sp.]